MENCTMHSVHEQRIGVLESDLRLLTERAYEMEKEMAVMQAEIATSLKDLSSLPSAIQNMNSTMITMQNSIQNNAEQVTELSSDVKTLSKKVNEIDNRDKFSMTEYLKKNWLSFVVGLALVGYIFADIAKGFLSKGV